MKIIKSCIIALALSVALTACAKPVTKAPKLEAAHIEAERRSQQELLEQQKSGEAKPIQMQSTAVINSRLNQLMPSIKKSGSEICQAMWGADQECNYDIELVEDDVLNAWADGKGVYITPKMVSFASKNEELANVLAHEYAHNVLKHPQSTGQNATAGALGGLLLDVLAQSQGINTGGRLSQLGGNVGQFHYSVDFEKEADYVGLYILARAGYDPTGALDFWRKFTTQDPNGLYGSRSHPSNPERTLSMKKTANEIQAKRKAKQAILPNLRQR